MVQRTFVFLHGSPDSATVFSDVLAQAPQDVRLICDDLPDHGVREDVPSLELAPFDRYVDELLTPLEGRVILVGYSFGALLAARALSRSSARVVERAVLIAGLAALPAELAAANSAFAQALESGQLDRDTGAQIARQRWVGDSPLSSVQEARLLAGIRTQSVERLARQLRRVATLATPERVELAPFFTPTLLLHGAADAAVPLALSDALLTHAKRGARLVVPGAPHALPVTHPDLIALHAFGL